MNILETLELQHWRGRDVPSTSMSPISIARIQLARGQIDTARRVLTSNYDAVTANMAWNALMTDTQTTRPAGQAAPQITVSSVVVVSLLALATGAIFGATVAMNAKPRRSRR